MSARNLLRSLRLQSQGRLELDRLSARHLRDLNLERVTVVPGTTVYQRRVWQAD